MRYHGFDVEITPLKNIQREKKDGNTVLCDGFQITVYADISEEIPVDTFTTAVGFEILKDSVSDAEQFAKDVIDSEEKAYLKLLQEFEEESQ